MRILLRAFVYFTFALIAISEFAIAEQAWTGDWEFKPDSVTSNSLKITKASEKEIHFYFLTLFRDHVGELEGIAQLKGSRATFSEKNKVLNTVCDVSFQLESNKIVVEATESCNFDLGAGNILSATYKRIK